MYGLVVRRGHGGGSSASAGLASSPADTLDPRVPRRLAAGRSSRFPLPARPGDAESPRLSCGGRPLCPDPGSLPQVRLRRGCALLAGIRALSGRRRARPSGGAGALQQQREQFPKAATKGDAATLERRIQGELARRGDSEAAEDVADAAREPASRRSHPSDAAYPADAAHTTDAANAADATRCSHELVQRSRATVRERRGRHEGGRTQRPAADGCGTGPADSPEGPGPAGHGLRVPAPEGGVPGGPAAGRRDGGHPAGIGPEPTGSRGAAAGGLLALAGGDRSRREALDSILRFSKDPEIQDKAVFALSQHGSPRAQQALRAYAERADVPEAAREKAIFWLGQNGSSGKRRLSPVPVRPAQERGPQEEGGLLALPDGRRRRTASGCSGSRGSGAGHRNAEAGALLGRPGRRAHRGAHRALCQRRPTRRCGSSSSSSTLSGTSPRPWTS